MAKGEVTCINHTECKTFVDIFVVVFFIKLWGCGGLMVSALDSGSRGPGSSRGRVIVLCSWARHFTLTVPLSTQEYK